MKSSLTVVIFSLIASSAFADPVFAKLGLSTECQNIIIKTAVSQCNVESLKHEGKNRMNPCIQPQWDIASSGEFSGKLEVGASAGDADTYWYAVTIENAAECEFVRPLTPEQ